MLCLGGPGAAGETAGVRVVDAEGFLLSLSDPACPALQNPEREVDLALFFGEGWDGAPLPAHGLPEGFAWSLGEDGMLVLLSGKGDPWGYVDPRSGYCEVDDGCFRPTRGYDPQGSMRAVEERAAATIEECPWML